MTTAGIPPDFIGGPGTLRADVNGIGFGYSLFPAQPTFYQLGFKFDTDLGLLSPNTPVVTYSTSLDIKRFVDYGHKIIWFHGLSDPVVPVLGTVPTSSAAWNGRSSSRASIRSRT